MKKRFRLSDHIMPRRMVRYFPWLVAESIVLYVVFKITAVVWRSVAYGMDKINYNLRWVVYILLVILMASFVALWEAVRLSRDSLMRMAFMDSVSDGSYSTKDDLHLILRSDEPWNDTAVFFVFYILLYAYRLFRVWYMNMINPDLTMEQIHASVFAAFLVNLILFVVFVVAYAAAHIVFTVKVHQRWSEDRMRRTDAPNAEKQAFM